MKFSTNHILPMLMCAFISGAPVLAQTEDTRSEKYTAILETYADIGLASYQDSLAGAQNLRTAIEDLLNNPTDETLEEARTVWRTARIPYEQSEVFVAANPVVQDWVYRVNAWPINESYIDYVQGNSAPNIVESSELNVVGTTVSIEKITPDIISQSLHSESGDAASGYHVIEYLLWGEDLTGDEEKGIDEGAGTRPASDFDLENCTNDNCARRGDYLYASVNLLIDDLEEMVTNWRVTGEARRVLLADPEAGISKIFTGLGSLTLGELAGDRLQASLNSGDENSEQDRFSNNTHVSYLFNARGVVGVYFGEYYSMQGELTQGASIADFMEDAFPELDQKFRIGLGLSMARMRLLIDHARDVEAFDLMIAKGNETGNDLVAAAIDALVDQSNILNEMVQELGLDSEFLGSAAL